ncbi:MAG TPA: ferrochelatase [Labilithrix sp.]|nr:ferrochelatase [Labilithrix sp.]
MTTAQDTAVVLIAHGTVESLDDLPEFLTNIRRGHAAPDELVREVRRRYEAIGGRSPLLDITREVARKLEKKLGMPTRVAMRLFHPYPKDVIADLAHEGIRRIVTVPLAQHSAAVYGSAMKAAAAEIDPSLQVLCAKNWGRTPELTRAFADSVVAALARVPQGEAERTAVIFTAHSLPLGIIQAGDPYEKELRASAEAVAAEVRARAGTAFSEHLVAFQSQGIGSGIEWLGPDLRSTVEDLARRGKRHVVIAPIGFLADHVEILYDLDIEAKAWGEGELGIVLYRSASLNAGDGLVDALAIVARDVLARPHDFSEPDAGVSRGRPNDPRARANRGG